MATDIIHAKALLRSRKSMFTTTVILTAILFLSPAKHFSKSEVKQDLDYMIAKLEDIHPNLYDFVSRKEFYDEVDKLKDSLPDRISDLKLYRELTRLLAMFRDGHTKAGENFYQSRILGLTLFPHRVKFRNERIFVYGNYSQANKIPIGSEILSINGVRPEKFIREVSCLWSHDNSNYYPQLDNPVLIGLWNNFNNFVISYKLPDSETPHTINSGSDLATNWSIIADLLKGHQEPYYEFRVIANKVGYIGFYGCYDLARFKSFCASTFRRIKEAKIAELIIDIRNNGGGSSSLGVELMQYISKVPYTNLDSSEVKISRELAAQNRYAWLDSTEIRISAVKKFSATTKIALRDNPFRFQGNCYLLINGKTFSSVVTFASAFQCYNVGKIIGSETGGVTVHYGESYGFNLPNTGLDVDVSTKKFYFACGIDNRRGVIPDFAVENTFTDEKMSRDGVLEFTLNLIRANEN